MEIPDRLAQFILQHPRLTVLSGAGVSTASGIAAYRDRNGRWNHPQPMQFQDFVASDKARKRYWSRSFAAWSRFEGARPNAAHRALMKLEKLGHVDLLVTQNVDDLHRLAGSEKLVNLHGELRNVRCLNCQRIISRENYQLSLQHLNSDWRHTITAFGPDGDARLQDKEEQNFAVAPCNECGGSMKPDVVFFGEAVPVDRVEKARASVAGSDALLVVGSSLMVFSGFRFARQAIACGKPVAIINKGKTRADDFADLLVDADCGEALENALQKLTTITEEKRV